MNAVSTIAAASTALVVAALPLAPGFLAPEANDAGDDNHEPANKVSVAASTLEIMSAEMTEGAVSEEHTLLGTTIKTSKPTDLVFQVTLECALWTDITVVGNDESQAIATVQVWIEFDGLRLPVAADEDPASDQLGKVVFCNRDCKMIVSDLDDEDATFEQFLRTRSANAFNWIALNTGSATHTIEAVAQLEAQVNGVGMAKAAVGKRTLVVEPVKLVNDATL